MMLALFFRSASCLFRVTELHAQRGSFLDKGVVILPPRRMNFLMFLFIVIDDFLKDWLNDLGVGELECDYDDTAVVARPAPPANCPE